MWRPLKVAEADQWLNRRGKYVVYAACLSLSLPSIIAIKAVTGSERRSHYLEPGPAMPLLCPRRSAKHQSGTWTLGRAHSSGIGITLHVQSDRIHAAILFPVATLSGRQPFPGFPALLPRAVP